MDRLVNDLLTLARLDEGVPMEMAPVELVALASEAVRTATAVGPEWPVQFSAPRPVEVTGDKDRLRQVLDNLLANVRAHTPRGHDRHGARRPGRRPGARSRCATPARACPTRRRSASSSASTGPTRPGPATSGGSGLGLSIVAAIVTAHGGTVSATSAPGEGLVVTVLIPIERRCSRPTGRRSRRRPSVA